MVPPQRLTPSAAYDCPTELCPGTSDRKSAPMDISTRLRLTRLTFDFEHHLLLLLLESATRLQLVSLVYTIYFTYLHELLQYPVHLMTHNN